MKTAPLPFAEQQRLENLALYDILDTAPEKDFDDLLELASLICDCPSGSITFIDKDRQWFKAAKQMGSTETPRELSICAHTILQDDLMIIPDATADDRFKDHPLVTAGQARFYAGATIVSSGGFNIGSVCVMDNKKKEVLNHIQQSALRMIAKQVSKLLELRAKNKMLLKYAETQLTAEKTLTRLTLLHNDSKDKQIAYELHENLAQQLAGIKLYLHTAAISQDLAAYFLQKSIELVSSVIGDIKQLSNSIVPTTLANDDYLQHIQDYAAACCEKHSIQLTFVGNTNAAKTLTGEPGFNLFKIVQLQLDISKAAGATQVHINIATGEKLTIIFEDNGNAENTAFNSKWYHDMDTRIALQNGIFIRENKDHTNRLVIELPLK